MPGTTMIGECRYDGPNGSVLPPETRHAKRLLKALNSPRLAASALLDAAGMVTVCLPSAATDAGALSSDSHYLHAVSAATSTFRAELIESFGDTATEGGDNLDQYERRKGMVEEKMGLALYLGAERAVDLGLGLLVGGDRVAGGAAASGGGRIGGGDGGEEEELRGDSAPSLGIRKRRREETTASTEAAVGTAVVTEVTEGSSGSDSVASGLSQNGARDERNDDQTATSDNDALRTKKRSLDGSSSRSSVTSISSDRPYANDKDDETSRNHERTKSIRLTLASCLESMHLQVASRTTTTWGRKKRYEIYDLPQPIKSVCGEDGVDRVREAVEKEFRAVFRGGGEDQCGVRVYALLRSVGRRGVGNDNLSSSPADDDDDGTLKVSANVDTYLYVQLSIGKPIDLNDESLRAADGMKKKKLGNEFVGAIRPGTSQLALTASRAPSKSRFTPYVLAAITGALCSDGGGGRSASAGVNGSGMSSSDSSFMARRVGDLAGTEPYDLLASAASFAYRTALGRYSRYANDAAHSSTCSATDGIATVAMADPLLEMNHVSTGTLVGRQADHARLQTGSIHGRKVANLESNIAEVSGGNSSMIAANGAGVIVDHSAASTRAMKRDRDVELGRKGDCPMLQRICWKWSGETHAASLCWEDDDDAFESGEPNFALPATKFKCGVVMEGPDVFEGLRELVAAGVAKAPLPNHVKDAPGMGSNTITVADGEFGGADSLAAV